MQVYRIAYAGHWVTGTLMLGTYAGHRIAYAGHWVTGSPIYSTSVVLLIIFCFVKKFLGNFVGSPGHSNNILTTIFQQQQQQYSYIHYKVQKSYAKNINHINIYIYIYMG